MKAESIRYQRPAPVNSGDAEVFQSLFCMVREVAAQLAERNERKQFLEFTCVDYSGANGHKITLNREIIGQVFPTKHDVHEELGKPNGQRTCTAISVFGTEEIVYVAESYAEVCTMLGM